jgi:glycosidase
MEGNLTVAYDVPTNFVDAWNIMLATNDLVNANTGEFDPRHMYGVTNQDVFRWPAIKDGTKKMLLGLFITTLHMPGIPLLLWGEEQAFYVLDNTADNYIYMADKRCHRARPGKFMAVMGWGHFNTTTSPSIQHCMAAMMTRSAWITETRRIRFGISSSPCITLD